MVQVDGKLMDAVDMPILDGRVAGHLIDDLFDEWQPSYAVLEMNHAMPRNGSVANFSLGLNTGVLLGVIQAWRIPLIRVGSGKWKVHMGLRGKPKDASRALAMELWPEMTHLFKRVRDDGRAEAALIGRWWCHQLMLGGEAERTKMLPDGSTTVLQPIGHRLRPVDEASYRRNLRVRKRLAAVTPPGQDGQ